VQRFLDALGYPRATLVGNSLGGWIATRFTFDHPDRVRHLYLLNSAGLSREGAHSPYTPNRESARRAIRAFAGRHLPVIPNVMLDAMVENSLRPAFKGFVENYDKSEELDDVLAQVRVPTTIIWGTNDRVLPLACAQDFHEGWWLPINLSICLLMRHRPQRLRMRTER
jgi:pimeloyl-ACP methyl ester carboxylesterase